MMENYSPNNSHRFRCASSTHQFTLGSPYQVTWFVVIEISQQKLIASLGADIVQGMYSYIIVFVYIYDYIYAYLYL